MRGGIIEDNKFRNFPRRFVANGLKEKGGSKVGRRVVCDFFSFRKEEIVICLYAYGSDP